MTDDLPRVPTDWSRLADAVRRRRERLGLTQEEVAALGGPSTASLRLIESGRTGSYRAKTLFSLDEALGWQRGTCLGILVGDVTAESALVEGFDAWLDRMIREPRPTRGTMGRASPHSDVTQHVAPAVDDARYVAHDPEPQGDDKLVTEGRLREEINRVRDELAEIIRKELRDR